MLKKKKSFFFLLVLLCLILFYMMFSTPQNEIIEVDTPPEEKEEVIPEEETISTNIVYEYENGALNESLSEERPPVKLYYDFNNVDFFSYISKLEEKGCIIVYSTDTTWKQIKVKGGVSVVDIPFDTIMSDKWNTKPYDLEQDYMFRKYMPKEDRSKKISMLKPMAMEKHIQDVIIKKIPTLGIDLKDAASINGKYFIKNETLYIKLYSVTHKNSLESNMNISIRLP